MFNHGGCYSTNRTPVMVVWSRLLKNTSHGIPKICCLINAKCQRIQKRLSFDWLEKAKSDPKVVALPPLGENALSHHWIRNWMHNYEYQTWSLFDWLENPNMVTIGPIGECNRESQQWSLRDHLKETRSKREYQIWHNREYPTWSLISWNMR